VGDGGDAVVVSVAGVVGTAVVAGADGIGGAGGAGGVGLRAVGGARSGITSPGDVGHGTGNRLSCAHATRAATR
jgi:hypothetical protein